MRLIAEEAVKRKLVPRAGRETIRILLQSHDLKPWREKNVVRGGPDRPVSGSMEEVLAIYERPYNPSEPVVRLDEKRVTLHADVRPARPMGPGKVSSPDCEYKRCGTANLFCAVEPLTGKHFTMATPNRKAPQFAEALETIIGSYPKHGSWLNQAEIEISLLARQCLGNRRIPTLEVLRSEVHAWNSRVNRDQVKIDWQFTRKKARQKFGYKPLKRN